MVWRRVTVSFRQALQPVKCSHPISHRSGAGWHSWERPSAAWSPSHSLIWHIAGLCTALRPPRSPLTARSAALLLSIQQRDGSIRAVDHASWAISLLFASSYPHRASVASQTAKDRRRNQDPELRMSPFVHRSLVCQAPPQCTLLPPSNRLN